jgi:hypothetical protein
MKIVIIQLTPEGLKENCAAIFGVETLNTVSFRTAKKMRYAIQGISFLGLAAVLSEIFRMCPPEFS